MKDRRTGRTLRMLLEAGLFVSENWWDEPTNVLLVGHTLRASDYLAKRLNQIMGDSGVKQRDCIRFGSVYVYLTSIDNYAGELTKARKYKKIFIDHFAHCFEMIKNPTIQ